jgi:hypothetical protein
MAHECPECYTRCHCGGDIDDCEFPLEGYCKHCEEYDEDDDEFSSFDNLLTEGFD